MDHQDELSSEIRRILRHHGRLPVDPATLSDQADLYQAGLTSHASVNVMLSVEDAFGIEFPDEMLTRASFQSIGAIAAAVSGVRGEAAA